MEGRPSNNNNQIEREEGVLKDVLDELDRERSRRAELEEQIRKLQEEKDALQISDRQHRARAKDTESIAVSRHVFVSMETQVKGYQQLIDVLTMGKPAIAAAAAYYDERDKLLHHHHSRKNPNRAGNNKKKTLPVHVVRLLEVMPWDIRAKQHIFGIEQIFEWQVYRDGAWQGHIRHFPTSFRTLPIIKAKSKNSNNGIIGDSIPDFHNNYNQDDSNNKNDRNILNFLSGAESQSAVRGKSRQRVLTNDHVTVLYDSDAGYPLPDDGGVWEWVGGWRVDKGSSVNNDLSNTNNNNNNNNNIDSEQRQRVDCDADGWSYVVEPKDFLLGLNDLMWDNPGEADNNMTITPSKSNRSNKKSTTTTIPQRTVRRRRWTRQRVLVDYLEASTATREYLKLLCENAQLSITAGKISDQLVETKTALTESENKLVEANDLIKQKDAELKKAGKKSSLLPIINVEKHDSQEPANRGVESTNSFKKTFEDSKADLSLKLSQWVQSTRKTSEDLTEESIVEELQFENNNNNNNGDGGDNAMTTTTTTTSAIVDNNATTSANNNDDDDNNNESSSNNEKFDWKKIGRGQLLMNKLKNQTSSSNNSSYRSPFTKGAVVAAATSRTIFRRAASEEVTMTASDEDL